MVDKDFSGDPFIAVNIDDPINKRLIRLTWEFMRRNKEYRKAYTKCFSSARVGRRECKGIDFFDEFGINPPLNPDKPFETYEGILSEGFKTLEWRDIDSAFRSFFTEKEGDLRDVLSFRVPSPGIFMSKIYQPPSEVPRDFAGVKSDSVYLYVNEGVPNLREGARTVEAIPDVLKGRHKVYILINLDAPDYQIKKELIAYLKGWRQFFNCKSLSRRRIKVWEGYLKALEGKEAGKKEVDKIAKKIRTAKGTNSRKKAKVRRRDDSSLVSRSIKEAEKLVSGGYNKICKYERAGV